MEGKNVTGFRYIAHLYCLAIQASFYSDGVECWIFVRRVACSILSHVRSEDIFLCLLHLAPNVNNPHALSLLESHLCESRTPTNLRTNFNVEGENVTGYRYIHDRGSLKRALKFLLKRTTFYLNF